MADNNVLKKLQELGYTFDLGRDYEDATDFGIGVKDKAGKDVARTILRPNGQGEFSTHPYQQVFVNPEHRRQGIASTMYKFAEDQTGLKAVPSETQNSLGKALWDNPSRSFGKDKAKARLTDAQILQMITDLESLSPEDKLSRRLGAGADAITYSVPDSDYVLKTRNNERPYNLESLDKNYIHSKQLGKIAPVEQPILIKRPDSEDFLLQKRLKVLTDQEDITDDFYNKAYDQGKNTEGGMQALLRQERARIRELPDNKAYMDYIKHLDNSNVIEGDIHRNNLGIDPTTNTAKAFDVSKFWIGGEHPSADIKNEALSKMRENFSNNMDKLTKTRIFRSIGPVAGMASQVVPSLVDLKEGNPNTAAARMVTSMAPAGTGELDTKLMDQANIADKSPELLDPTYIRTLKNIGDRRMNMGKSPVVESMSGQKVDTSATEDNDFMNLVKARMRANSSG